MSHVYHDKVLFVETFPCPLPTPLTVKSAFYFEMSCSKVPTPVLPVGFDPEEQLPDFAKIQSSPIDVTKLKTRLCRHFMDSGECPFGDKCAFAHGMHEMSVVPSCYTASSHTTESASKASSSDREVAPTAARTGSSIPRVRSTVAIPAPRSRAAVASVDQTLPRVSSFRSDGLVGGMPPKYGDMHRTGSRVSLDGLSDTLPVRVHSDANIMASLRRRPQPNSVISRVPSSTATSHSLPPAYETSYVLSDTVSVHSGDFPTRSALEISSEDSQHVDSYGWNYHQRRAVATPVSQINSPVKNRIQSPMAAGGPNRFTYNPYDLNEPYVAVY